MPRYADTAVITSSCSCTLDITTSCTWTVPTGVNRVTFEIWGAGGGGGAVCCCDCYKGGPGGAGGGYSTVTISTVPGCQYVACAGYGGMADIVGNCTLHWCCYGRPGGTSYVTGFNLSNFCATGGEGGRGDCYYGCGCSIPGGVGYGGAVTNCGSPGTGGHSSSVCMLMWGVGAGPGFANAAQMFVSDACCRCMVGTFGVFPGGGGSSAYANACCCCSQGGVGANGLVRIKF